MTDLSKIDVPKKLRLNMGQRSAIADALKEKAIKKAEADYDKEAVRKSLTERLISHAWQDKKMLEIAKNMPDGSFPCVSSVRFMMLKVKEHETGMNGEKTEYVDVNYDSFHFHESNPHILPYKFAKAGNVMIAAKKSKAIEKYKGKCSGITDLANQELEEDLVSYLSFDSRIEAAGETLKKKALETLKQIKSVKELQETWPEAFVAYHSLYAHQLTGTSIVPAAPVSVVSQMIADFPDIEDVMAA